MSQFQIFDGKTKLPNLRMIYLFDQVYHIEVDHIFSRSKGPMLQREYLKVKYP